MQAGYKPLSREFVVTYGLGRNDGGMGQTMCHLCGLPSPTGSWLGFVSRRDGLFSVQLNPIGPNRAAGSDTHSG